MRNQIFSLAILGGLLGCGSNASDSPENSADPSTMVDSGAPGGGTSGGDMLPGVNSTGDSVPDPLPDAGAQGDAAPTTRPPPDPATVAECKAADHSALAACDQPAIDCFCTGCADLLTACESDPACLYLAHCSIAANCFDASCFLGLADSHPQECGDLAMYVSSLMPLTDLGTCLQASACSYDSCGGTAADAGM